MISDLALRRCLAEAVGTGILVTAIIASGIMATDLTSDVGLQLLINALSTVLCLSVLIWALGPVSGAHFNPVVTATALLRREVQLAEGLRYMVAQAGGGLGGTALAHSMYKVALWAPSHHQRSGVGQWIGEIIATAGLMCIILTITGKGRGDLGPILVPAWIGSAYFFTSSTSFANPAVVLARSMTDTFAGIAPRDAGGFIIAEVIGGLVGAAMTQFFYPAAAGAHEPPDLPAPVHLRGANGDAMAVAPVNMGRVAQEGQRHATDR